MEIIWTRVGGICLGKREREGRRVSESGLRGRYNKLEKATGLPRVLPLVTSPAIRLRGASAESRFAPVNFR